MAVPRPRSLQDFMNTYNLSLFDARLPCVFCKGYCTVVDLQEFIRKELQLVWKGGLCFAACTGCLYISAFYEHNKHLQLKIPSGLVQQVAGESVLDLNVRCVYCLAKLSREELVGSLVLGLDLYLVRHQWRGVCRLCILSRI